MTLLRSCPHSVKGPPLHSTPSFPRSCSLENGTTYNAYLIYGADKTALVDASHEKFHNLFLEVGLGRVGALRD